jgi:hypothetical protein
VTSISIACVVEGDGEVHAVPILIRRIAQRIDPGLVPILPRPIRIRRNRINERFDELERALERAVASSKPLGAVLILLDSEDDCPAQLAPNLVQRATQCRSDVQIGVVLAKREYEAWFLAAAESIQGKRGLPATLQSPNDPEAVRGAKEWLRNHMPPRRKYTETVDQPALTAVFDLDQARQHSNSFDKCYREIERLLRVLYKPETPQPPEADSQTKGES